MTSSLLVILIFFTGVPPINAVYLDAGEIVEDQIMGGTTVIFKNVTVTIRSNEKIPIQFLQFTIYNARNNQEIGHTKFEVSGNKIEDSPENSFSIIRKTQIPSNWYGYGYNWGYDENIGMAYYFDYGYGYGYGDSSFTDITIIYDITFYTTLPGIFYATLAANCSTHTFLSDASGEFYVISQYPPIPQKQNIFPNSFSAITDKVNISYDFIDLEDDLDHLTIQISGPAPYNVEENYIKWTFNVDEDNPWDEWNSEDILVAQDMGIIPSYNSLKEEWIISIDTNVSFFINNQ